MKNKKISIISTSYSFYKIEDLVKNIKNQQYSNIELIFVDDLNLIGENRIFYFDDNIFVNIFRPDNKLGYYKSLKFGLMQATGDYVVFNTKNCKFFDNTFFKQSIEKFLSSKDIDIVFGKSKIDSIFKFNVKEFKFKEEYTPANFIKEWEKLRMNFVDYFDLNSFIFKKRILFYADAFTSNYENALSLDTSTLLKSILISKKIAFINLFSNIKFIKNLNLKDYNTSDLTEQIKNHFAISFDMKNFLKQRKINIPEIESFLNKYADYAIHSIYFDYFMNFNQKIFNKIFENNNLINKKIYIYGKGWIGLALEDFLKKKNIIIEAFIDDYRIDKNIITFDKFKKIYSKDSVVIIATYKYKDAFHMLKKLSKLKLITVLDLFEKEIT